MVTGEVRTFSKMVWDALPITRLNGILYPKMGYVLKRQQDVSMPKEVNEQFVSKKIIKKVDNEDTAPVQPE